MYEGTAIPPAISVKYHQLEVVYLFTYLGSTPTNNLSLEVELDTCEANHSLPFSNLSKKVWENRQLTQNTNVAEYKACVISTPNKCTATRRGHHMPHKSTSWMASTSDSYWCLRSIIARQRQRAGTTSMYTILRQRRIQSLVHVHRMEDGRYSKNQLYGELVTDYRDRDRL